MFLIFTILVLGFCVLNDEDYVLSQDIIEIVNSDPKSTWKAGINPFFVGKTWKDVKIMMGRNNNANSESHARAYQRKGISLPDEFDVYEKWENCTHPIRNQENCGSCWAFSSAEAMSDRFCIAGKEVILSPQDLVSCDTMDRGCNGDVHAWDEWLYFEKNGVVTDRCFPYASGGGNVPKCPYSCDNGEEDWKQSKHFSKKNSTTHYLTPEDGMEGLLIDGSIQGGFTVYQDFFHYKSGVYTHKTGSVAGGHAIKIQGWGVDNGVKYWNVANSWGQGNLQSLLFSLHPRS